MSIVPTENLDWRVWRDPYTISGLFWTLFLPRRPSTRQVAKSGQARRPSVLPVRSSPPRPSGNGRGSCAPDAVAGAGRRLQQNRHSLILRMRKDRSHNGLAFRAKEPQITRTIRCRGHTETAGLGQAASKRTEYDGIHTAYAACFGPFPDPDPSVRSFAGLSGQQFSFGYCFSETAVTKIPGNPMIYQYRSE